MVKLTFTEADGTVITGEGEEGGSVMRVAVAAGVSIWAECGGICSCATCHCYVDPEWLDVLDPPESMEDAMLDAAGGRTAESRLTCQIPIKPELDGMTLRVPPPE